MNIPVYIHENTSPTDAHDVLWPVLRRLVGQRHWLEKRAFDLGCGNGATADMLSQLGFDVIGVDPSEQGIKLAKAAFPNLQTFVASTNDDLAGRYGRFPLVISLEVIEHCLEPRRLAKSFYDLLAPGGLGIISTPYHGYFKNLAISLAGGWDFHHSPLWDGGHIKFFSIKTLGQLLVETGFGKFRFERVGRIPMVAKSMIAIIEK